MKNSAFLAVICFAAATFLSACEPEVHENKRAEDSVQRPVDDVVKPQNSIDLETN